MRLWRPSRKSFLVVRFDHQRTSSHLFYQLSSERLIRRLYIWIRRRHLLFHISCCFIGFHFLIFLSKFPPLFLLGLFLGFWFVSMIFLVFQWLSDCICFWPELFTCSIRLPLRGLIIFESSTLLLSLHITFLVLRLWCRLFYSRFFHGALRQTKQMCVSVTSPSRFLMIGFFFLSCPPVTSDLLFSFPSTNCSIFGIQLFYDENQFIPLYGNISTTYLGYFSMFLLLDS